MASIEKIVMYFSQRRENRRAFIHDPEITNAIQWNGGIVYTEGDDTLYSYGDHWPMASFLGTIDIGKDTERHLFVKNGDRRRGSTSTNVHLGIVQRFCNGPTVSHGSLRSMGVNIRTLQLKPFKGYTPRAPNRHDRNDKRARVKPAVIFDWRPDTRIEVRLKTDGSFVKGDWPEEGKPEEPFTPPSQGMFIAYRESQDEEKRGCTPGIWHTLGAALLEWKNGFYLCSLDENVYFVSQLPSRPRDITHAFQVLKPPAVLKAEKKGTAVKRQGEWFFVPTGMNDEALATSLGITLAEVARRSARKNLPVRSQKVTKGSQSVPPNLHDCLLFDDNGRLLAKKKVFHRNELGRATGEHVTLDLGDEWHEVHRNTEIRAWSQGGSFD